MGSLISCGKCYSKEGTTIITFSNALVLRYCEGVEVEEEDDKHNPNAIFDHLPDADWFQKIHCIDESHTTAYGLTYDDFNKLARRLERKLNELDAINEACQSKSIIQCYQKNPECGLNCEAQCATFVDCVDVVRLKALKKKEKGVEVQVEDDE